MLAVVLLPLLHALHIMYCYSLYVRVVTIHYLLMMLCNPATCCILSLLTYPNITKSSWYVSVT